MGDRAGINRQYIATAGGTFREGLPQGYRSAVFTNNSGHYLLIRLGAMDPPADTASAERIVPPYTQYGVSLRGNMVAGRFTDTTVQLSANVSSGLDGVCDSVYSASPITEFSMALPGATASVVNAQPGQYSYFWGLEDFTPPGIVVRLMVSGPAHVRQAWAGLNEDQAIASSGVFNLVIAPLAGSHAPISVVLAGGYMTTAGANYVPPISFGPTASGSDLLIPAGSGLYCSCNIAIISMLMTAEYRT